LKNIQAKKYVTGEIGELTIQDILKELNKPGLDPRSELEQFEFAQIYTIKDVHTGMVVPGIVTNLTRFGAFVDIGVKQDGLVHVSEIAHTYISDPADALKLNDKVMVKVLEVDIPRSRIALSIKQTQQAPKLPQRNAQYKQQKPQHLQQKQNDLSSLTVDDALAALKKKFGK